MIEITNLTTMGVKKTRVGFTGNVGTFNLCENYEHVFLSPQRHWFELGFLVIFPYLSKS